MKKILFPFLLLTAVLLSSCSGLRLNTSLTKIQRGMTKEEVLELCKKPLYQRFDDLGEEWEYRGVVSYYWTVVVVRFEDDRVVALNMFTEPECNHSVTPSASTEH